MQQQISETSCNAIKITLQKQNDSAHYTKRMKKLKGGLLRADYLQLSIKATLKIGKNSNSHYFLLF